MTGEFWALLTQRERDEFKNRSRPRRWRRGEVLFPEGGESEWVAVVQTGRVKASSHTAAGSEVLLAVRGPGALLGEFSAIDKGPRSATLQALEPVTALVMTTPDFEGYLSGHGRIAYLLMRMLSQKLRDADRKRIEFGAQDTTGRVAARLVELAERFGVPGAPGEIRIELRLSQDELAGWVGSSREAVSKALGVLRSSGWIRTSRLSVVVLNLQALRDRAA
ncbi:MAG TPA: Crp/Fnr family transcriptional regulator [Candidatus Limnocylindrales bacterium]|nr:Crp/Fnr family transcriptional regulator [Candidatus Limnocylindrales bacterium]